LGVLGDLLRRDQLGRASLPEMERSRRLTQRATPTSRPHCGAISMATTPDTIVEPEGRIPVVARADLVVVGGGPAGISAAVAAARNGLSVILLERYAYLGGLAS